MSSSELQALIDDVADRLSAPAVLEDEEQRLIVHSSQDGPVDEIRRDSILRRYTRPAVRDWFRNFGIVTAKHPLRIPRDTQQGILGRLCVPIDHHGMRVGYLWLIDDAERLDGEAVASAAKAAQSAGLIIFEEILAERHATGVLEHLLSPAEELRAASARHIADSVLDQHGQVVALVVQPTTAADDRSMIAESLRDVTRRHPPGEVCGVAYSDHGVLVTRWTEHDRNSSRHLAEAVCDAMNRRLTTEGSAERTVVAGIGDPRPTLADAFLSYREARLAARVAATIAAIGPVAFWQDLGVFRTLAQLPMSEAVTSSLDPRLVCLFQSADPAVLATLETFLDLAGDVKATAELLHVHRGTLYYRLQKAEQLARADLHKGPDRLAFHLGFKLARLAGLYTGEQEALHS